MVKSVPCNIRCDAADLSAELEAVWATQGDSLAAYFIYFKRPPWINPLCAIAVVKVRLKQHVQVPYIINFIETIYLSKELCQ